MGYVYEVNYPDGYVFYQSGGETRSQAIISLVCEIGDDTGNFINYRARFAKDYDGKKIETELRGILDMEELMSLGYKAWWDCENCECDGRNERIFDYVNYNRYKCRKCGHIGDIPYAEE